MNRRHCLENLTALTLFGGFTNATAMERTILKRPIPHSGELLPAVGLGTWQTFDAPPNEYDPLRAVLKVLVENGGTVIDSSPMYGRSEEVTGSLSTKAGLNKKLFLATKVWTTGKENGIRQMQQSMKLLQRKQIDLMQVHNLTDWKTHLATLRGWKESGLIRYFGITHYSEYAYNTIEQIMKTEPVDFVQINYSLQSRKAAERILPLAHDRGIAILVNRPFEEGELFNRVKGKTLPAWADEFDCRSWGQFFLKFILAHPAVTCAIPGTSKPHHMLDNMGAAYGKLPDKGHQQRMINIIEG